MAKGIDIKHKWVDKVIIYIWDKIFCLWSKLYLKILNTCSVPKQGVGDERGAKEEGEDEETHPASGKRGHRSVYLDIISSILQQYSGLCLDHYYLDQIS